MRIALAYDLIYPYSKGGVEKRVWDLARNLVALGHEVHVFGTKHWHGPEDFVKNGVHVHGVCSPSDIHASSGRRSIWQAVGFAVSLGRHLIRQRFDVIDVQNMAPLSCLSVLVAAKLTRSTPIVTWHEVWRGYWIDYMGWLGYAGRLAEWLVAKWAPNHFAVSNDTMQRLRDLGARDVVVTPNGVDCARVKATTPSELISDIIYVGRLVDHKNVDLLIDATAVMMSEGLAPTVLIVGDGPARASLESRVALAGLTNVIFLDRVETEQQVFSLMQSSSLFALPSSREGFGLAALEASANGLPVLTVTHPHNAAVELITEREIGLVSSPTPTEFAALIRELLEDKNRQRALSDNALEAARRFDWPRVAAEVELEYRRRLPFDRRKVNLAETTRVG